MLLMVLRACCLGKISALLMLSSQASSEEAVLPVLV